MAGSNPLYAGDRRIYVDSELNFTGPTARENEAEILAQSDQFKGKPRIEVLNVTAGWDSVAQFDIVVSHLQQLGLYYEGLLYCGADAECIEKLGVEEGNTVECSTLDQIRDSRGCDRNMLKEAVEAYSRPAIIVYDPCRLELVDGHKFRAKKGSPLRHAAMIVFLLVSDEF